MKPTIFLAICAAAQPALAGCLSFGPPRDGSACGLTKELTWTNAPASPEPAPEQRVSLDKLIDDPALAGGVYFGGDATFQFRAPGTHLLEVFLTALEQTASFVLEANGSAIDTRYVMKPGPDRLAPTSNLRRVVLLGIVEGGQTLRIRTDAKRYILAAARWTSQDDFESRLAPAMLERVRLLLEDPFVEGLRSRRQSHILHLCERLALSRQEAVRREGLLGLTRAFYWVAAENHRAWELQRTEQLFVEALKVMPQDPVLRQMIHASCTELNIRISHMPRGPYCNQITPVAWQPGLPDAPTAAPEWAVTQRRLAARMEAITRWWVEKRQAPNGELGGGWDDDSEILRHWGPLALGLGSDVAARGTRKLAEGLLASDILLNGYDRRISDVEHASEPSADTEPILAALAPEDASVRARLAETTACSGNWIARQPDGRWRFRGSWFNCKEFDPRPERAVDVFLNVRALGPALWRAYLTRDKEIVELLSNWAASWVEAMRSTEHGKPAGLFPSAVQSADGNYLIRSREWDKPNVEWDYYQWSGWSQETMASLMLALYDLTGEKRWLVAAGESFQVMLQCDKYPRFCEEIRREPSSFYIWRKLSGDARYDRAFGFSPKPDVAATLALMTDHARRTEARLSHDFDMMTSEVLYTDRVYYQMTPEYRQRLFGGDAPRGERYPSFAVTWPATAGAFARAVLDAGPETLQFRLYSFETNHVEAPVRVWRLEPGRYRWDSVDTQGSRVGSGEVTISRQPQVISLPLPAQREITMTLRRLGS